ncbi:MAG: hypothetical protein L6R39_006049 [Caloplaca ligustica]|nr:MAG: hypothetical protein L6R39_006049 [Caloplaca ligustica]
MALSHRRLLHKRASKRSPRRVKANLKQVVGDPFQDLSHSTLEHQMVRNLITASNRYNEDPRQAITVRKQNLENEVIALESSLKRLLGERVVTIISYLSDRLSDPKTKLTWSRTANNCQNFCDSLLQWDKVGSFLGPLPSGFDTANDLPYMMSFVTRPGSYLREKVISKFDVPNGLTEEYLLKFRQGRHDDSDLVDTLQEYWHDWGKRISGPILIGLDVKN